MSGPICTGFNPGTIACFPRAVNPLATDLVSGMQEHGPNGPNETVGFTLAQVAAFAGQQGGPFLPLAGGQLTGQLSAYTLTMNPGGGNLIPAYPVGNSPPSSLITPASTVLSQLVCQSQSTSQTNPEWTGVFGNWSTAGQATGAQKVALYAGSVQSPGSGPAWSLNTLVTRNAAPGVNNTPGGPGDIGSGTPGTPGAIPLGTITVGYELDWNNFDQDLAIGSGFGVGMWINMLGSFPATAAIYMSNVYDHGRNNYGWHDGILFSGDHLIQDNTIFDGTSAAFSYQIAGAHTTGILDVSTAPYGYQSNGTRSTANFLISDSAPTVLAVNGTHTHVIDPSGATITGLTYNGFWSSATASTSGILSGSQWQNQGSYNGWNYTNGGGETDFVNSHGAGAGGFNFYNVASSIGATPTLLAQITTTGINSAPIGITTPAAGAFTSVSANLSGGGTGAAFLVKAAGNAAYAWDDTSGAANAKKYDIIAETGTLYYRLLSDDEITATQWLGVTRAGTSATLISAVATNISLQGIVMVNSLVVGGGGPTITSGTGAATGMQPKGSIFMRTDGGVGTTMYVSQGGGTWNAVAGV